MVEARVRRIVTTQIRLVKSKDMDLDQVLEVDICIINQELWLAFCSYNLICNRQPPTPV